MTLKNIILFGESGSGKSSVINLLMNQSVAPVSDKVVGCTLSYKNYNYNDWSLFDTAGLSEGSQGTVDEHKAIKELKSLLCTVGQNGISLAIMVIGNSKITETMEQNYKLFVKKICMGRVPVLLMVTRCEQYDDMGKWWEHNKIYFENYRMTFANVVCGCAKESSSSNIMAQFRELYREKCNITREALIDSIKRTMSPEPWAMISTREWMKLIMKDVLLILFSYNISDGRQMSQGLDSLIQTLLGMGWEHIEALSLVNDIKKDLKFT